MTNIKLDNKEDKELFNELVILFGNTKKIDSKIGVFRELMNYYCTNSVNYRMHKKGNSDKILERFRKEKYKILEDLIK